MPRPAADRTGCDPAATMKSMVGALSRTVNSRSLTTCSPDMVPSGFRGRLSVAGRAGDLVEPVDRAEKALLQLGIGAQGPVVPRVDERVSRHRRAVGELPAGFEDDAVVDIVGGLDRLGDLRRRVAGGVIGHQTGEEPIDDPPAIAVVGTGRDQRVRRFRAIDQHQIRAEDTAATASQGAGQRRDRQHSGSQRRPARPASDA